MKKLISESTRKLDLWEHRGQEGFKELRSLLDRVDLTADANMLGRLEMLASHIDELAKRQAKNANEQLRVMKKLAKKIKPLASIEGRHFFEELFEQHADLSKREVDILVDNSLAYRALIAGRGEAGPGRSELNTPEEVESYFERVLENQMQS